MLRGKNNSEGIFFLLYLARFTSPGPSQGSDEWEKGGFEQSPATCMTSSSTAQYLGFYRNLHISKRDE